MLDDKMLVKVTNISGGPVVYKVPELSIRREFQKGETKNVTAQELRALLYLPGGKEIISDYLAVKNQELLDEFYMSPEPEYNWTEKEVKDLLLNGSVNRLKDCLDFAPSGIVEMVKDLAVALRINDMSKRQAILESTKFDVTNAIKINEIDEADEPEVASKPTGRRVSLEEPAAAGRRTTTDIPPATPGKYKITG
jgi:hypothetical protein